MKTIMRCGKNPCRDVKFYVSTSKLIPLLCNTKSIIYEPQRRREHREEKQDFTRRIERVNPNIISMVFYRIIWGVVARFVFFVRF
jgi:hypothetical protein